ncbi:hypothetical protein [Candidatus Marithrix sp. Canyon 246]|nr:hypothetical protein [Candidatus Marithrix sp. Canyon 246]
MKKLFFGLVTLLLLISFSGCANKVHNYAISSDNMLALKTFSNSSEGIKIVKFTDSNKNEATLMCRLSTPVGTPKGETFASYIENAFTKELMVSDMYNENSTIIITANLNDIYGSTVLGNAYWKFDITVKSSNGNSYNVNTKYDYESSLLVYSACTEMQRSFVPAVQKLNGEIIKHPKFKNLIQ